MTVASTGNVLGLSSNKSRQQGAAVFGLLAAVVVFFVLFYLAVQFVPVYFENAHVKGVLNTLHDESKDKIDTPQKTKQLLMRRFAANDVTSVHEKNIDIKVEQNEMHVKIEYEVRRPLLANIDVLFHFSHSESLH